MAKHNTLTELFSAIANAIRAKGKTTAEIVADDFPEAIENLKGGTSSSEVTAGKAQVLAGYTTITNDSADEIVQGTMKNVSGSSTITLTSADSRKVVANDNDTGDAGGLWATTNSDGVVRLCMRIPEYGYYYGGHIMAQPLTKFGSAAPSQVLSGATFTSTSGITSGTMPNNGATGTTLAINGSYTIPAGYTSGGTVSQSVTTKAAATYNTSTSDQTIAASQWLSGAQTIKAVTTANISAANIKKGVTITVGDANSSTRIANVAGTYSTVSSGQTALTAGVLLSGYSGFANGGGEVKGTMTNRNKAQTAATTGTTGQFCYYRHTTNKFQVIPAYGYYGTWSWDTCISIPVTDVAAKTVTPSTSEQTAVSSGCYTTGAIKVAAIPNQKSDSGNTKLNGSTQTKSFAAGYYANAHGATVDYYSPTTSSY